MADKGGKSYAPNPQFTPKPPPKKTGFAGFAAFLWNSDTKEFLGRTGKSWLGITVFYIIFYSCLALFFAAALFIFLQTIEADRPKWTLGESLIGTNPGVGFRPMPDQEVNVDSSLIWINRDKEVNQSYWNDQLVNFLKDYQDPSRVSKTQPCTFSNPNPGGTENLPCRVNVSNLFTCNEKNDGFGYLRNQLSPLKKTQPCVVLKLNKIFNWTPVAYNTTEELDEAKKDGMPDNLYKFISVLITKSEAGDKIARSKLQSVWFSCEGERAPDKEALGPVKYFSPAVSDDSFPGIPTFYYPYLNQPGYLPPFVFAQFESPGMGQLVNIQCKAWAKNIEHDDQNRAGLVHFEFLIDGTVRKPNEGKAK